MAIDYKTMLNYYRVLFQEEKGLGVGRILVGPERLDLPDQGRVESWVPIIMELKDGDFPDYLANDLGCRLCSERLRTIFEKSASSTDELQWLKVLVRNSVKEQTYFILHFSQPPDVLDKQKTIFADHFVVKPVLSRVLVGKHQVFGYPRCGPLKLFISHHVKSAVEEQGCTGMEIAKAPVV